MEKIFGTEFDRLCKREIELTEKKQGIITALAAAKASAGEALVEGDGVEQIAHVARLHAELDATSRALDILRGRRQPVIEAELKREAAALRADAVRKQGELAALKAKTSKALAELSRLEGVEYGDWLLGYQKEGLVAFDSTVKTTPRSEQLAMEIQAIEGKAAALESAGIPAYGCVDLDPVTSDEDVIMAVLRHKSAGPSAEVVQGWLAACASNPRAGGSFGNSPRRCRIEWNGGEVDTKASYVNVPALARRRTGVMNSMGNINPGESAELFDIQSGNFQAAA